MISQTIVAHTLPLEHTVRLKHFLEGLRRMSKLLWTIWAARQIEPKCRSFMCRLCFVTRAGCKGIINLSFILWKYAIHDSKQKIGWSLYDFNYAGQFSIVMCWFGQSIFQSWKLHINWMQSVNIEMQEILRILTMSVFFMHCR